MTVAEDAGLYCVFLDGKSVRTPARKQLGAKSRALADALGKEWDAQDPVIDRDAMPLTRLVSTALDRVGPEREAVLDGLLSYVDSELLCYRASHPDTLKARQLDSWQPILDWLDQDMGISFQVVEGIMPAAQSQDTVAALSKAIAGLNDEQLTGFQACAAATKSLALSLALVRGRLSAESVSVLAHLDETFQVEQWGQDREALERRRAIDADINAIGAFLSLI